jgi:hypothetical protein
MTRPGIAFLLAFAMSALAGRASGQTVLDQSNVQDPPATIRGFFGIGSLGDVAQTFTAGQAGELNRVELPLTRGWGDVTEPLRLDIRRTTTAGAPVEADSPVLGSLVVQPSSMPVRNTLGGPPGPIQFLPLDLSGFDIAVAPGDVLAIVLQSDEVPSLEGDRGYYWEAVSRSIPNYPGGSTFLRDTIDGVTQFRPYPSQEVSFRTFVTVPEPAAAGLLAVLFPLMMRRRRSV